MFIPASSVSILCFEIIVAAVIIAVLGATRHAYRDDRARARKITIRVFLGYLLWLGLFAGLIASDKMRLIPLQGIPLFFGSILVVSLAAGLSPFGGKLAINVPVVALVAFQAFRLPLELVLHTWSQRGTIPTSMTWNGQNWDIVAGALAFVVWPMAANNRRVAWIFNIVGFGLLLNVMRVAMFSTAVPFGWGLQPPLQLWLHLPYVFIGPVCVAGALFGHIVLTRALLRKS